MAERDDGGPAFPAEISNNAPDGILQTGNHTFKVSGMSLRDYFAAKSIHAAHAMAEKCYHDAPSPQTIADWSYELADAMLRARAE